MTKILTSGISPNRKLHLAHRLRNLRRFASAMQQFSEAESKLFHELLNKVAPKEKSNLATNRERIEVESHLISLGMALMMGNSKIIDKCKNSLDFALEQLQHACISDCSNFDVSEMES